MTGTIKRLEVSIETKKMALSFIEDIKNLTSEFVIPVVGDFIIDRYRYCRVERKNLEHDSLIHDLVDSFYYYGGAANVANIIGTLAQNAPHNTVHFLLGCGKEDPKFLRRVGLANPNAFSLSLYCDDQYEKIIPVKTRYIGINRNEYLFRVDSEPTRKQFPALSDSVARTIVGDIGKINTNVLFISDYAKGFISDHFLDFLDLLDNVKYKYCNIRPKRIKSYANRMYFLSFNKTEFIQAYDILLGETLDIISFENIVELKQKLALPNIIITFGANGFIFCGKHDCCVKVDSPKSLTVGSKNIIGAGDMISASFAFFDAINSHFFLEKYPNDVLLYLVNCSAFLKVYTGDYTISLDKLVSYINGNLCLF